MGGHAYSKGVCMGFFFFLCSQVKNNFIGQSQNYALGTFSPNVIESTTNLMSYEDAKTSIISRGRTRIKNMVGSE